MDSIMERLMKAKKFSDKLKAKEEDGYLHGSICYSHVCGKNIKMKWNLRKHFPTRHWIYGSMDLWIYGSM